MNEAADTMTDVYLAHAEADRARAMLLAEALQRREWSVTWRSSDTADPRRHRAVVVLWSPAALATPRLVRIAEEAALERRLVQALAADVRRPRGLRRGPVADLVDWDGSDGDPGLGDLLRELDKTAEAASGAEPNGDAEPGEEGPPPAALDAARRIVGTGEPQVLSGHHGEVFDLDLSPDGRLLASASADGTARLWDLRRGTTRAVLSGHDGEVNDVAISPDGRTVATASDDGTVGLWSADSGTLLRRLDHHDEGAVFAVTFSPAGALGASADEDGFVTVWRAGDGGSVWLLEHRFGVAAARFLPDGTVLVTGDDGGAITMWDMDNGEELARFDAHDTAIADLAVSPDGSVLATSSERPELGLWNLDGSLRWWADDVAGAVYGLAFSGGGDLMASSDDDGIVLWAAAAGEPIARIDDPDATRMEFSPDGSRLAWASGTSVRVLPS